MYESDRHVFPRPNVYNMILNTLNDQYNREVPDYVRRLQNSPEFQRVKSMTPEEFDNATHGYPAIDTVSKVLMLINTELSWWIFINSASEDDIYAVASSDIITGRRLELIKEDLKGRSDVSPELLAAVENLTSSETSKFDKNIFEEIVYSTDSIEELKALYDSKVVFRNILDDPRVLKYLADKTVRTHSDDVLLRGDPTSKYPPVVLERYNNFLDYFIWYTDTFYSSKYCPTKSNRNGCILGAIDRDDVDMFKKTYSAFLQDPTYMSRIDPIQFINSPKIANYIVNETDPRRAGYRSVLALAAIFWDAETFGAVLRDSGSADDVLAVSAVLYVRKEPNEEIKTLLMNYLSDLVSNGATLDIRVFFSDVTYLSRTMGKFKNTRWLNELAVYLLSLVDLGMSVDPNMQFSVFVSSGLLRYVQHILAMGYLITPTAMGADLINSIPDDVPHSELKGFVNFILFMITPQMRDATEDRMKAIIDECVVEYEESSTRSLTIPLTVGKNNT